MPLSNFSEAQFYRDAELIRLSQYTGIPEKDLLVLLEYAQNKDVIILLRPVEVLTKSLHEEGKHPTKNFKIKGKSSSWGAWSGFIPIDQNFSKLNGALTAIIEKANKDVQACIDQKNALEIPLNITENRFQELKHKGIILPQKEKEGEYLVIYCPRPHGGLELCYAKKINTESEAEYAIYTGEEKPFYVLADTVLKRPLIADYDLLAIFNPWKNYTQDNVRLNPDIIPQERRRKLSPKTLRRSIENAENFYAREDPNLGNVAPITVTHISGLNAVLKKGLGLERFHHNDDVGSPASNPEANYPIISLLSLIEGLEIIKNLSSAIKIIIKDPKGDLVLIIIENLEQFVDFIHILSLNKYYRIEVNPLWELPLRWAGLRNHFFSKINFAYCKSTNPEHLEKTLIEMFSYINLNDVTFSKELINIFKLMAEVKFDPDTLSTKQEDDDLQTRKAGDRRGLLAPQTSCEQSHLPDKKPIKKLMEKFFNIIQNSLFFNSTLVVTLGHSFGKLKEKKALSEENIDRLIGLTKILRNNIQDLNAILNYLPRIRAELIDDYFTLAETHICANKLNITKFKNDLDLKKILPVNAATEETSCEQDSQSIRP